MSKTYFTGLNYTLGNEDTRLEMSLVRHFKSQNIVSVCGSGGRALPLVSEGAKKLCVLDLSREQILLARLREASYKQLSYDEFILFWGYYPTPVEGCEHERESLFHKMTLDDSVKSFFQDVFHTLKFRSILYVGKWEQTFAILAKINKKILGKDFDRILTFSDINEQRSFYQLHFPKIKWKMVLFLLGNRTMFNALLYKGDFIQKNYPESHFDYYYNAFENLFTHDIAQKSFFLHLCFYGKINSFLGLPIESQEDVHTKIKNSETLIEYHTADLVTFLQSSDQKYDFVSFSDVPSYFGGELEKTFMQKIRPGLEKGAIVVNRYYLKKPDCDLNGFEDITHKFQKDISSECVQMYRVHVYQYLG